MNLHNFFTSGINFDAAEESLAFRFRFLNALGLVAIITPLIFVLLAQFGINSLGDKQLLATELYAVASFLALWYLRERKHAYTLSARLIIVSSYLVFCSAVINVPDDELRVIWFYILVVATYVLLDRKTGLTVTAASIAAVSIAKFGMSITISGNAFFTFVLSLCVTSGITYAYTKLADSYFERMLRNFNELHDMASKDPLTGLWNARAFYDMSNKLIQVGLRNTTPYCTLFIDLDHFKSVNDQYGHEMGDVVLCAIANSIAGNIRESDIVGRIGGEEFVVFLPHTDTQGALQLAEKLRQSAESMTHAFSRDIQRAVTLSIGVAKNLPSDRSIADIQKRADMAMYNAKRQGRNRVSFLSPAAA